MLDAKLIFSEDQAITVDAGSTNVIDLGTHETALGEEEHLRLVVMITETFAGGTSLEIQAREDGDVTPADVWAISRVFLQAELVAGTKIWDIGLPHKHQRYMDLNYNQEGDFTGGKVTAFITAR
jgi:hypothetical protein